LEHEMLYQVQERERIRKEEQDYMQQQYVAFTAVTGNINIVTHSVTSNVYFKLPLYALHR